MLQLDELNAILEESTQSLPGTVRAETDLASLPGWDSMGLVIFIDAVRLRLDVELAVHELRACSFSPQILELIERATAT